MIVLFRSKRRYELFRGRCAWPWLAVACDDIRSSSTALHGVGVEVAIIVAVGVAIIDAITVADADAAVETNMTV